MFRHTRCELQLEPPLNHRTVVGRRSALATTLGNCTAAFGAVSADPSAVVVGGLPDWTGVVE